jgi:hypothetical protein
MAIISGHGGIIKEGSGTGVALANLRGWTIEQTQDTIETTVMSGNYDAATSRTYVAGPHTWTISGDIFYDNANTQMLNIEAGASDLTAVQLKLYAEDDDTGNKYWEGNVVITSFSVTSSVDGMVEASFAGQGTGALAINTQS